MGDRNNPPIKFGPEWLRNLSREPSAGGSGPNNQNTPPGPMNNTSGSPSPGAGQEARAIIGSNSGAMAALNIGASGSSNLGTAAPTGLMAAPTAGIPVVSATASGTGAIASGPPIPGPSTGAIPRYKTNNTVPKVLLAKLRYGREEMLALYDRSEESPDELKQFDLLYQPRSKPPFALNSTFEEDVRDNIRGGPPIGAIPTVERYSLGRGGTVGRGGINDARGRPRMPFVRQTSLGRGNNSWHVNNTRMPNYNTGPEEDASLRPWNNSNGGVNPNRTTNETAEWNPNKMFRRRQNNNTNWRQPHTRDEGDEWRTLEGQRNRPTTDKWDREWGDRPNPERQQSWNSNRRTWADDSQNNDDNLPEWAVDNAEAGAGTFDSSGAFHGYSNDDSNLPKSQETSFPLARSHTHGSFARSKTAEEGSAEWWASEKAKKLSAKKFDTGDIKFAQTGSTGSAEGTNPNCKQSSDDLLDEISAKEEPIDPPESPEGNESNNEDTNQSNIFTNQFQDSKTFDALMRSEIDLEDSTEDRNNYQSVMMTPNSAMRQTHQNLIPCPIDRQQRNMGLLQMLHVLPPMNQTPDNESRETPDDKLVEKILDMTLEESKLQTPMIGRIHPTNCPNQRMPNPSMHLQMGNQMMQNHGIPIKGAPTLQMGSLQGMQNVGMPNPMNPPMQNVGMHNSALNSSLALPLGPANNNLVMPMQNVPPPVIPNPGMQARLGFQPGGGMPMLPGANVGNASLFMAPNNQPAMQNNEMPIPNPNSQNNMFPMHPIQHAGSQAPFSSMYNIPQPHPPITPDSNLVDAWYYEDPEKVIQGPFSSKEMYNWYRAGFFSPSLMVRRACEAHLRPLGSYGPVVPFIQLDMLSPFPMSAAFDTRPQQGMGIEDSLWSQPAPAADLIWMQQVNHRNESRINNLPMFFWEPQAASAISSNSLLPEEIAKEMKTEDQILAQLRASQNLPTPPNVSFMNDQPPTSSASATTGGNKPEEGFPRNVSATPNLEELQKLIQTETLTPPVSFPPSLSEPESEDKDEPEETEVKEEVLQVDPAPPEVPRPASPPAPPPVQQQPSSQVKTPSDPKQPKQIKNDTEKPVKKETNNTKSKNKKAKEEKKEEVVPEVKVKEEEILAKVEKRSVESSPTKSKKEEKQTKKEQEKEKKELIKDGFTIVKGVDKATNKENKKKAEEAKAFAAAAEEAERKKKEEEKLVEEEEKKRKIAEAIKKAQEQQQQRQECTTKKAPWSAVATQAVATSKEGLTLAEIQRLEREKKVEQMKEQQQMMQIIAQQQAAALAREQEMQAGLGWAKKKASNVNVSGQSLAEIQAETRKAAAAAAATAAAAAAQALDETLPAPPAAQVPWASAHNGGFWETQANATAKTEKAPSTTKTTDNGKPKKKVTITTVKKETTPAVEFEAWCTTILTPWSSKIDVPTFVGFLKDIESPYEVKDYVKCYLGETKDSGDFARQFLERRSKLLRVGMVTPSDDLCSPAMAINPRNSNLGDYQEVKGKGKKTKKNKMLKVDARILGFSVTASEDRINVGDIDTV